MVQMQYLTMNKALGPRRAAILSLVALYDPVEPFIIKYAPAVATLPHYSLDCFSLTFPIAYQEAMQQHRASSWAFCLCTEALPL